MNLHPNADLVAHTLICLDKFAPCLAAGKNIATRVPWRKKTALPLRARGGASKGDS
jgi:hypothetical protein